MMRGVKVKEDGTSDSFLSRSFEKSKLDLNDLLARNELEKKEDRKRNILILSLITFLAFAVILILIFS